ncbi:F0F1 ATP synthase subunit C [Haloparvum alkalitolerans]|uniref:ATP synthase subunit K n=1 Tax=Haloparvum TaxID=1820337 RepID=UPI00071E78EE|nr:ATP synthase subunit K [Haloparvum sedimenti]
MLEAISEFGNVAQSSTGGTLTDPSAAAALAVGLAALGAGYAERGIGSAAVGAMAEDESLFVNGLILTVLPETIVILALVVVFIV